LAIFVNSSEIDTPSSPKAFKESRDVINAFLSLSTSTAICS
jgi:hypothetical protein